MPLGGVSGKARKPVAVCITCSRAAASATRVTYNGHTVTAVAKGLPRAGAGQPEARFMRRWREVLRAHASVAAEAVPGALNTADPRTTPERRTGA
jgi:hypothetical protein